MFCNNALGRTPGNFLLQSNPDEAETIIQDKSVLPPPAGRVEKTRGKTVFGFVGGPGDTKGWDLVRGFMARAEEMAGRPDGPHVVLFDTGRGLGKPWYSDIERPGTTVADPFHWTFASHALEPIDVMLMPSRVRESFGLAAREALSLGKECIIRSSGALAEIKDCRGVTLVGEGDDVDSVLARRVESCDPQRTPWTSTAGADYAHKLMSL